MSKVKFKHLSTGKKILVILAAFFVIFLASLGREKQNEFDKDLLLVARVIDGDTIELEGGSIVRYIGIDTPETTKDCYSIEAANKNKDLVEGKYVRLEKDVSEADRYGRLLRYVYVEAVFVNEYLVREGYANVSTYPPDVKYQNIFLEAGREAREENKGLWGLCEDNL